MRAALLGAGWAALTLVGAARVAPAPPRARALVRANAAPRLPERSPLEKIGRLVWRAARCPAPSPARARAVGAGAVLAVLASAVAPPAAPLPLLVAWAAPRYRARRAPHLSQRQMEAELPQVVDLLSLAVGAGLNVSLAVAAAGRRGTGPVATELRRVTAEASRGRRLADVLDELPDRAGEALRPLTSALAGCERYGAPVAPALERIADEVRRQRQRRAEEAARKVPVAMLFPLVLCILPAFALLTVAPLVAGALRQLRL